MAKRQIKVTIDPQTGAIKVDNTGNPNEQQILRELSDLAKILNGDKAGFKVEEHKHTHGGHTHTHIHSNGGTS
jgi:hypothetical protein